MYSGLGLNIRAVTSNLEECKCICIPASPALKIITFLRQGIWQIGNIYVEST
jgi:hypothetical protein